MKDPRLKQPKTGFKEFLLIMLLILTIIGGYISTLKYLYSYINENYVIIWKLPSKDSYFQWYLIIGFLDTILGNIIFPCKAKYKEELGMYYIYKSFRIFLIPKKIYLNEKYRFVVFSEEKAPYFSYNHKEKIFSSGEL